MPEHNIAKKNSDRAGNEQSDNDDDDDTGFKQSSLLTKRI